MERPGRACHSQSCSYKYESCQYLHKYTLKLEEEIERCAKEGTRQDTRFSRIDYSNNERAQQSSLGLEIVREEDEQKRA